MQLIHKQITITLVFLSLLFKVVLKHLYTPEEFSLPPLNHKLRLK